jgi:hypothetical protein
MPEMLQPPPAGPAAGAGGSPGGGSAIAANAGRNQTVIRGQAPEERATPAAPRAPGAPRGPATAPPSPPPTAPPKLTMPTAEALGLLVPALPAPRPEQPALDWGSVRARLDARGATYYRLEKTPEGGFRFLCSVPHPQDAGRQRQFETVAATEAEAMRAVLDQVEAWGSRAP